MLANAEQLHVEDQRGVRGNIAPGAARAIAHLGRDHERALAADLHAGDTFVPAADHLPRAEIEVERLAPVAGAVELLAMAVGLGGVVQPAGVMDGDGLARDRLGPVADDGVDLLQLCHGRSSKWS